jgi:hypothetical protein
MFNLIAAGLPYETLIKKTGGVIPSRRNSVMKLLGDASLIKSGARLNVLEDKNS